MEREKFYEQLPIELLSCFYYSTKQNYKNGISIFTMKKEITVIQSVARKKGIALSDLYYMGQSIIQTEKKLTFSDNNIL